jgi:hypothetical protein
MRDSLDAPTALRTLMAITTDRIILCEAGSCFLPNYFIECYDIYFEGLEKTILVLTTPKTVAYYFLTPDIKCYATVPAPVCSAMVDRIFHHNSPKTLFSAGIVKTAYLPPPFFASPGLSWILSRGFIAHSDEIPAGEPLKYETPFSRTYGVPSNLNCLLNGQNSHLWKYTIDRICSGQPTSTKFQKVFEALVQMLPRHVLQEGYSTIRAYGKKVDYNLCYVEGRELPPCSPLPRYDGKLETGTMGYIVTGGVLDSIWAENAGVLPKDWAMFSAERKKKWSSRRVLKVEEREMKNRWHSMGDRLNMEPRLIGRIWKESVERAFAVCTSFG